MSFSTSTFQELPAFYRDGTAPSARMAVIRKAFGSRGVTAGLQALNEGVPHRYSAIFRLDGSLLHNTHIVDKLGEVFPEELKIVPLADSFCQLVLKDGFLFSDNTRTDRRLDYSPYQQVVMSYHGVPIVAPSGELYGTLCQFDMVEQVLSDEEFACMQEAARLVPMFVL